MDLSLLPSRCRRLAPVLDHLAAASEAASTDGVMPSPGITP